MPDFNTLPDYNLSRPLQPPKYRVVYHLNNDKLVMFGSFVVDTKMYEENEEAVIKGYEFKHFSADGLLAYTFTGWTLAKGTASYLDYYEGNTHAFKNKDLHLYAQWVSTPTIEVTSDGLLSLKQIYKDSINNLNIPEYFGGTRIKEIATDGFLNASINTITIPVNITDVRQDAFNGWSGTTIRFVDGAVTTKYPALTLHAGAFNNTPNLTKIVLPYRWHKATGTIFSAQENKMITIYIRNTRDFMDEKHTNETQDIEDYIAVVNQPNINYTRVIHWGYND